MILHFYMLLETVECFFGKFDSVTTPP